MTKRLMPEKMAELFGEKDIFIGSLKAIESERPNKPQVEVKDYVIPFYFGVSGGYGLCERERELIGENGRAHSIHSPLLDGHLLLPGIEDVVDADERRRDIKEWLKENAKQEIGIIIYDTPVISAARFVMYDRFITRHPLPMQWNTLIGHVETEARVWAKYDS